LPLRVEVQLRAHATPVGCLVSRSDGGLVVELDVQQRGVAPGQSAVLYEPDPVRGDRVLGQAAVLAAA
jgi:tRNA-specific 2-thiouridylase